MILEAIHSLVRRRIRMWLAFALVMWLAPAVLARSPSTGALTGTAKDTTDGVVPSATITGTTIDNGRVRSQAEMKAKIGCSALAGKTIPAAKIALPTSGATISSADNSPGSGQEGTPDFVPSYCDIKGSIAPVDPSAPPINFEVDIPANWNGKAIQIGGNGMDGFVPFLAALSRGTAGSPLGPAYPPDVPYPIAKGYATYGSDSGHGGARAPGAGGPAQGGPPPVANFSWMANKESLKNFAYEQIKKTHDVAIEILLQMYGTKPKYTYFMGESQGGREALMAVAHYGDDYNGVSSSVGLVYFTGILLSPQYRAKLQLAPGAWLPPAKAPAVAQEVLRQCDALDGRSDGVINNYYGCNRLFDPAVSPHALDKLRCANGADTGNDCLSDAQIATLNAFHSPLNWGFPLADGNTDWPGEPAGSESAPPPLGWLLVSGSQPSVGAAPPAGVGNILGAIYGDPQKYNLLTHDFTDFKEQIQALSELIDVPTDWSKFFAHGGKLIYHSAATDYLTNPRGQARMYEVVVKRYGQAKVDKSVRYYVTPAANHGSISFSYPDKTPQARYMDLTTYLEDWVEKGETPPDAIPQKLMDPKPPYTVTRSRPLCRYPKYPHYNGSGDPDKMESYTCTAP
jgi:hypothetical protein